MSKIDDIKGRLAELDKARKRYSERRDVVEEAKRDAAQLELNRYASLDIRYLLARLDKAEKVMQELFKYTGEYGREEDATKLMREYDPSREWKSWEMP